MTRRIAFALIPAVAVGAAIFMLTRQDAKGSGDLAWRVEQMLMRIVPPTGKGSMGEPTWAGLTIRRLAHIAEFGALGMCVAIAVTLAMGRSPQAFALAAGICLAASVADEVHKIFVPMRHFDAGDLILDAIGYLLGIAVVYAVGALAGMLAR